MENAGLKQCIVKFFNRVVNWLPENSTCLRGLLYDALHLVQYLLAIMVQCKLMETIPFNTINEFTSWINGIVSTEG